MQLTESEFKDLQCDAMAASFNASNNEVLINIDYVKITQLCNRLLEENAVDTFSTEISEEVTNYIRDNVINEYSFRLACHVINSFYHKKIGKWEEGIVDSNYLSPAAMSGVADSISEFIYEGLAKDIKKQVQVIVNANKTSASTATDTSKFDQEKWKNAGVSLPEEELADA